MTGPGSRASPGFRQRPRPAPWVGQIGDFYQPFGGNLARMPPPRLQNAPDPAKRGPPERWPSGLRRTLGKRVCGKPYRGFESHSLRQRCQLTNCFALFFSPRWRVGPQIGPQARMVVPPKERRIVSTAGLFTLVKGRGPAMHIHQAGGLALAAIVVSGCGPTLSERNGPMPKGNAKCEPRKSSSRSRLTIA